jgi:cation diffusion facilitator CzcD-associated flavoprotein CzcO
MPSFTEFRGDSSPSVVIVGGGFGGIAAGVKLTRAGFTNFTIIEKSDGPGGTWWDNRYPGAEVDVGSHLYSFSFKSNDWTRSHARQPELQHYLETVIDEYALRPHFRFGTTAVQATWDESDCTYLVELDNGESLRCNILVTAVGLLNVPRYPDWPGLEDFAGPKFHTSRWEPEHDLKGKRVAVVGTGSTASQIVPTIAPEVAELTLYQREPGWVTPKGDRDYTEVDRARYRMPFARRRERWRLLYLLERNQFRADIHKPGTALNALREDQCRQYINTIFKERPDLREAVTPTYGYPGKRPVLCGTFYPALLRDNVELVPRAVVSVTATGIVDSDGVERPADVLVMATGFQPANYIATLDVVGRGGLSLAKFWDGEPQAFLGLEVPNFPNFYMLYGPNTNGGEIVSHLERQAEYVVRRTRRMAREDIAAFEVRPSLYRRYNAWLQKTMAQTSWVTSNNYYKSASGRIVTQWPYGPLMYSALTWLPSYLTAVATRSGRSSSPPVS